jgi:hypothetical protein
MNKTIKQAAFLTLITLMISASTALYAQISSSVNITDDQIEALLDKIDTDTIAYKAEMDRTMSRTTTAGRSYRTLIRKFQGSTARLRSNFTAGTPSYADVQDVLDKAAAITEFMRNNRISMRSDDLWTTVRSDLNTLNRYNVSASGGGGVVTIPPSTTGGTYSATPRQMRDLFTRLKQRSLAFRQSYERWSNQFDRPNNPSASYDISQPLTDFDVAVDNLSRNYRTGGSAEDVLRAASPINRFVADNRTNADIRAKWNLVRTDLDTLAGYYSVRWNWDDRGTNGGYGGGGGYGSGGYSGGQYGSLDTRLTGTYRLNASRSDNVTTIVDQAMVNANYDATRQDRVRRGLERRLTAPDTLVFEMRGQQITMAGRDGQTVTLNADGVKQTETSPNGRTVTTSVTATDRDVTINYEGDRMNDYYVSFMPTRDGQLRVTRRIYLEDQNQTVTATSVYDKISPIPQWTSSSVGSNTTPGGLNVNEYLVPNNTPMVATLDSPLSTRNAQNGDRFSMTVTSPSQYRGAVIEGTVSGERSGIIAGRANMSLNFATIRMGSRVYNFAGIVDQVRNTNGDVLNVNNEGVVRDSSQTNKTVTRAGIGAILGAIIGAVAGGGSGAAIGATVGAGAGAGTVILQGRDNLDLAAGSEFSITATAPSNMGQPLVPR